MGFKTNSPEKKELSFGKILLFPLRPGLSG
jgi:hypothetical protein